MKQEVKLLKDFFTKKTIGGEVSINDLHEKEFSGHKLSAEEQRAIKNYTNYRIKILNSQDDEEAFHKIYRQLQVVANLGDWKEFLKPDYE
ncbi:MAG TPA: hypothetical protein VNY73_01300 [Bacteroidia bacterium]|jgi:hypothetical protein|nr:hypothetical protein [Bacteroidia bacterium]